MRQFLPIIFLGIAFNCKSQTPEFSLANLRLIIFSNSFNTIDSFLKTKHYSFKPQSNGSNEDWLYYENDNRKDYADGVIIKKEKGHFSNYSVIIAKSDEKLYSQLKLECQQDTTLKLVEELADSKKILFIYSNGIYEYNFSIFESDGYKTYNVEGTFKIRSLKK